MSAESPIIAILPENNDVEFVNQIIKGVNLGENSFSVIIGTPENAVTLLSKRISSPRYLLIDIGNLGKNSLNEIDAVAEYCEAGTRVVVIGLENDLNFYRELRKRGIVDYFVKPANITDVQQALFGNIVSAKTSGGDGKVICFMSAASSDGSSTIAINTAYAITTEYKKSVVLVDMDYQFGMIAKNLDLPHKFGIKEVFDNPGRGIDSTLIESVTIPYKNSKLKVISAPNALIDFPHITQELISDLINTLKKDYDFVVIDLPHIWTPLVSSSLKNADYAVMVAQLWLRSISHSSRLLAAWSSVGINKNNITLVANRSGAKFKEAISASDFEKVCGLPFIFYFLNDTKSVIAAENNGRTILEDIKSDLGDQFRQFAEYFVKGKITSNPDSSKTSASAKPKLFGIIGNK